MSEPLRIVSYGGGVQSTALLVLAVQGYIPHRTFIFANVGEKSEHPKTLRYVHDIAFDYAWSNGVELHEVRLTRQRGAHAGDVMDLYDVMTSDKTKSIPIPMRGENGAPGTRSCTAEWKIAQVAKWCAEHGATVENPARVAIGFSVDEVERATDKPAYPHERPEYPLLTLEHRLAPQGANREQCKQIIASAGLPIPNKSSCYFCPFHKPTVWADMERTEPELFEQSAALEDHINRNRKPGERLFLTRFGRPLRDVFANTQLALLDDWDEDEGYRCGDRCDT